MATSSNIENDKWDDKWDEKTENILNNFASKIDEFIEKNNLQQQGIFHAVLQSRDMQAGLPAFLRNNKLINNLR